MSIRTETEWAIRNLELAGFTAPDSPYDGLIAESVKELLLCLQKQRHSGGSHHLVVELFNKVANREALTQQYWDERYAEAQELAKKMGDSFVWTEETFEDLVMKKPKTEPEE